MKFKVFLFLWHTDFRMHYYWSNDHHNALQLATVWVKQVNNTAVVRWAMTVFLNEHMRL